MSPGGAEEISSEKSDGQAAAVLASSGDGETERSTSGRRFARRILKKSDLYSSLWKGCDELRGGMDASQYKDYVLTLLFVKYVSDKRKADQTLIDVPDGG